MPRTSRPGRRVLSGRPDGRGIRHRKGRSLQKGDLMLRGRRTLRPFAVATLLVGLLAFPGTARAAGVPHYDYATPIFGLATAPDGSLVVADAGAGIVQLRKGRGSLIAQLPAV